MERIAQFETTSPNQTQVPDPFIAILPFTTTNLPRTITTSTQDIFLMDRQPVIRGARSSA
jgi:hypothetical protein